MKSKKIYFAVVGAVLVLTVVAFSVLLLGKNLILDRYNESIVNTGHCIKAGEPNYSFSLSTMTMVVSETCQDSYGYDWKVLSVLQPNWKQKGLSSQTKILANDEKTEMALAQVLDPNTNALRATAYGLHTLDKDHVEIELEPMQYVSAENALDMPGSVFIFDKNRNKEDFTIVFAPTDTVTIDTLGGKTTIDKLRVLWEQDSNQAYTVTVKSDDIKVGAISIAELPFLQLTQVNPDDDTINLQLNFKAHSVTDSKNIKFSLGLDNLEPAAFLELVRNATSIVQQTDKQKKADSIASSLENVFDLASHGASGNIMLTADENTASPTNIKATVEFEKDAKNYITKSNAFSILDQIIVDANIEVPAQLAATVIDQAWLQQFVSSGLINHKQGQLSTTIHIKSMDANVNGRPINL